MGLKRDSFEKAYCFLKKFNEPIFTDFMDADEHEGNFPINTIIGHDRKSDGGYETIQLYIENITAEQLFLFHSNRNIIKNSSFIREPDSDNVTCIGWY